MKKLMLFSALLLTMTSVPVFAEKAATVEKIEASNAKDPATEVMQTHNGKEAKVAEKAAIELNDVISTSNNIVSLKLNDGATWTLEEKTKFAFRAAVEKKAVYELLEGAANYSAADKSAAIVVKINDKSYELSAGAKVHFSYADKLTELKITEGTVKFGDQVFDKDKTVRVDEQGKASVFKLRGVRG